MGEHKKPGRKLARPRFEIRAEQAFLDLIAAAAQAMGESASDYVRAAVRERLKRDGFEMPGKK